MAEVDCILHAMCQSAQSLTSRWSSKTDVCTACQYPEWFRGFSFFVLTCFVLVCYMKQQKLRVGLKAISSEESFATKCLDMMLVLHTRITWLTDTIALPVGVRYKRHKSHHLQCHASCSW